MAGWVFAAAAEADFGDIIDYVEHESGVAMADRLCEDFYRAFDLLASSPRIGSVKEYAPGGVRAWILHSYVIFYLADAEPIRIVRILHGASNLDRVMKPE